MRTVNLSGLIGREICLMNCKGDVVSTAVYECVGYGADPDTNEPTLFLLNKSNGNVFERVLSRVLLKKEESTNG